MLTACPYLSKTHTRDVNNHRQLERRLGKPALVRETSRTTWNSIPILSASLGTLLRFLKRTAAGIARALFGATIWRERDLFDDVVMEPALAERVRTLARSVRNSRAHGAPLRHVMLCGAPGTGKTLVAKRMAQQSGLDFAIMSGGDVGPLGMMATTELHNLISWARQTTRGLMLVIDEAEAVLGDRRRKNLSEAQRNSLNALLYHTGKAILFWKTFLFPFWISHCCIIVVCCV